MDELDEPNFRAERLGWQTPLNDKAAQERCWERAAIQGASGALHQVAAVLFLNPRRKQWICRSCIAWWWRCGRRRER